MEAIWILLAVIGSVATIALLLDLWAWWSPQADEVHFAPTSDGWEIALHELKPNPSASRQARPVILCHGILMSRHCWLPRVGVPSVARELQRRGYWIWIVELRGSGESRTSRKGKERWDYPFTDYADLDLPAIVKKVREETGADAVDWIGHSLGGMVGYTHLARHGAGDIEKMVTLGSPVYMGRQHCHIYVPPMVPLFLRPFSSINLTLLTRGAPFFVLNAPLPWVAPFINLRKMSRRYGLGVFTWGVQRTGKNLLSTFHHWFQKGGSWLPHVATSKAPFPAPPGGLLALHGRNDLLVPPKNVEALSEWFPGAQVEAADDPQGRGFGHLDLLTGPVEVERVAERIDRFLQETSSRS